MAQNKPAGTSSDKQAQILAEACRLFAARGFHGTSIRDIAKSAGMTNAGLYHHFIDKNDLFLRLVVDLLEKQCGFTEQRLRSAVTATEKLRAFMLAYGDFFEHNTLACIASSRSFAFFEDCPQREEALRWRDRYEGILRDIIRQGIASGEFRPVDAAMAGRAVLSCLNWLQHWYSPSGHTRPPEIVLTYADMLLNGIAAAGNGESGRADARKAQLSRARA
jgi:AcrR family transcriptional regulator